MVSPKNPQYACAFYVEHLNPWYLRMLDVSQELPARRYGFCSYFAVQLAKLATINKTCRNSQPWRYLESASSNMDEICIKPGINVYAKHDVTNWKPCDGSTQCQAVHIDICGK